MLVDTGMHEPGSMANLERAFDQTGHRIEDVRLIVVTHAHTDHCGQAPLLAERAGCEVWMHPAWTLHAKSDLDRTIEVALQSGVPEEPLRRWAERRRGRGTGQAGRLRSDRDLVEGVVVETDVGAWTVVETPGHAPSHVCLHQPERRLLISGDHLLGRVSQYFDVGYTPDPVGEFLQLAGQGRRARHPARARRPRAAVHGRPRATSRPTGSWSRAICDAVRDALADGPRTAFELARTVYADRFTPEMASWLLTMTRAWLVHLQALGEAEHDDQPVEHWSLAS